MPIQPLAPNPEPLVSVRQLQTFFFADEGTTKAVDGASFDVLPGRTLGIVGGSGRGKSVTARSILRIVERPGKIVEGQNLFNHDGSTIDLVDLAADAPQMRGIRVHEIA